MPIIKISDLTEKTTPADGDLIPIVDVSDNSTKKVTRENLFKNPPLQDDSITPAMVDGDATGFEYVQLKRTTLGSSGDTITVSSIPARKYLKIVILSLATGGTAQPNLIFNADAGNNYAVRYADHGAGDATSNSRANIPCDNPSNGQWPTYTELEVINIAAQEKLLFLHANGTGAAGAATTPTRRELTGKWANTSDLISSVTVTNGAAGDFAVGSEVIVLGHD